MENEPTPDPQDWITEDFHSFYSADDEETVFAVPDDVRWEDAVRAELEKRGPGRRLWHLTNYGAEEIRLDN